jgi:hypothetical protein
MTMGNATTSQPTGQAQDKLLALKPQCHASKILLGNLPLDPKSNDAVKPIAGNIGVTREREREGGLLPCELLDDRQGKLFLTDKRFIEISSSNGDDTPMPTNTSNNAEDNHDRTSLLLTPFIIETGNIATGATSDLL